MQATTVEQTGKKWKKLRVLGTLLLIAGVVTLITAFAGQDPSIGAFAAGAIMSLVSFVVLIYARIGAWWHHG
jgi:uncharacterized membrane protein HdeD (DUF308 family)